MNPNALRYAVVACVGLFVVITGEWRGILCAAIALIVLRLWTQGNKK